MRTFKLSTKLAAAGLLATTAAFVAPSAFANDHDRGADYGQVSHRQQSSHSDHRNQGNERRDDHRRNDNRGYDERRYDHRHDSRRDDDRRYDGRGHSQPQSWHDHRDHGRVVYTRQSVFYRGHTVPVSYRHAIQPVPAAYRYRVPVAPRGYSVGYYQGYSVVYDPGTFLILSVIDLLANN